MGIWKAFLKKLTKNKVTIRIFEKLRDFMYNCLVFIGTVMSVPFCLAAVLFCLAAVLFCLVSTMIIIFTYVIFFIPLSNVLGAINCCVMYYKKRKKVGRGG